MTSESILLKPASVQNVKNISNMQQKIFSAIKALEDKWKLSLKIRRHCVALTIEIVQFESLVPLPVLVNYYLSLFGSSLIKEQEEKILSVYEDNLSGKKIYDHIRQFDNDLGFSILTKDGFYFDQNNYCFWISLHFRGVISKDIPSDLNIKNTDKDNQALYPIYHGDNPQEKAINIRFSFYENVKISGDFIKILNFNYSRFCSEVQLSRLSIRKGISFSRCKFNKNLNVFATRLKNESFLDFSYSFFSKK